MTSPALEARDLTKTFGRHRALGGVSLTVSPGEVVGLLGPNGAGKTTTVKIVTGLVRPTSGTARLFGQPSSVPAARARLGYLPELFRFPDWMTGRQVVRMHAELAGIPRAERAGRSDEVLERVGLGARGDDRVRGYSKGMSQRLGLAQALVGRPELLLLDEPTSALDPVGRREVRDLVGELRDEGVAVLLNSHLLSEVERLCDRVTVMNRGQVRFQGRLQQLTDEDTRVRVVVARPDDDLADVLLDFGVTRRVPPEHPGADGAGTFEVRLTPPWDDAAGEACERIAHVVAAGPWGLRELTSTGDSLEDAFVRLVEGGDR